MWHCQHGDEQLADNTVLLLASIAAALLLEHIVHYGTRDLKFFQDSFFKLVDNVLNHSEICKAFQLVVNSGECRTDT